MYFIIACLNRLLQTAASVLLLPFFLLQHKKCHQEANVKHKVSFSFYFEIWVDFRFYSLSAFARGRCGLKSVTQQSICCQVNHPITDTRRSQVTWPHILGAYRTRRVTGKFFSRLNKYVIRVTVGPSVHAPIHEERGLCWINKVVRDAFTGSHNPTNKSFHEVVTMQKHQNYSRLMWEQVRKRVSSFCPPVCFMQRSVSDSNVCG